MEHPPSLERISSEHKDPPHSMTSDYAIETDGLQKIYRTRWTGRTFTAVAGLTLRVPVGSKFGLLGANGAGKTTFVKMLLSAVRPTSGRAALFGHDSQEAESRRPVGYLPENHRFPTYFTGTGMLDFYGALSGMSAIDRKQRTAELLELVGLERWGDVRIKKYSKGMLQRLGLAQALMHRPQLLVLDEPTDGVDPAGRRHIRDILNSLTGTGVTIFLNSHLLSEVETFCDYVAILRQGHLALEGKMSSLLTKQGVLITARDVNAQARRAMASLASTTRVIAEGEDEGAVEFTVLTTLEANRAIDQLRAAEATIHSVIPSSNSLEDIFIEITGSSRSAGSRGEVPNVEMRQ
jgi:ABC-2 type transport system ATP-binding protein